VLNFPRKVILDWLDANLGLLTKDGDKVRVGCCPWCGRSRPAYVYYIPINMFRCYRCGMKANLYKLVEKVNPDCMTISQIITNIFQGREAYGIEFSDRAEESAFEDFWSGFSDSYEEKLSMPVDYSCDFSTPVGKTMWSYAERRNLPRDYMLSGEMGVAGGTMKHRLVFLVIENHKVVYWFGRGIWDWVTPKVRYPKATSVGRGKGEVVFGLDKVQVGDKIACCEGGISALSATRDGWKGIGLLGNDMSYAQAAKISSAKPSRFVYLREDGISMGHASKQCLVLDSFGIQTEIGTLINGDPNDDSSQLKVVYSNAERVNLLTGWM